MNDESRPATEGALNEVHRMLTQWALDLLAGRLVTEKMDAEGNIVTVKVTPTSADISAIRAFLKDNAITAPADEGSALHTLREKLRAQNGVMRQFNPDTDLQ